MLTNYDATSTKTQKKNATARVINLHNLPDDVDEDTEETPTEPKRQWVHVGTLE